MTSPTAPTIDATGIHAPQYADILTYLQTQYQAIYGTDVYLGNDSQDGQFLAIIAAAINDSNAAAIAVYNAFSPATAQGNGLSSNVKINGIQRLIATNSSVDITISGVAGTTITNGVVSDDNSTNSWNLPASVTIPNAGTITVTATAQNVGAITAPAGTITKIQTPTYGWQSAINPSDAAPGNPVETDAALRIRQQQSVAIPSQTVLQATTGALQNLTGVSAVMAYENSTGTTDSNGLPAHSVSFVVEGGDAMQIAQTIYAKKTPGCATFGTTSETVYNAAGIPMTINFNRPSQKSIAVAISLHALTGYTSLIAAEIQNAVATYINNLTIGADVLITRLYVPAQLSGSSDALTFEIVSVAAAIKPGTPGTSDIAIAFNQYASCQASDVIITVV